MSRRADQLAESADPIPKSEEGFALISAIWLLLLAASMVALMMALSLDQSKVVKGNGAAMKARLARDSAVATVAADLLFNGARSEFATLPASADYEFDGTQVHVELWPEAGKIDLNEVDLEFLDEALRKLGVDSSERSKLSRELEALREQGTRIGNLSDMEAILVRSGLRFKNGRNLTDFFTVYSGQVEPDLAGASPKLREALDRREASAGVIYRGGMAVTLISVTKERSRERQILRLGASISNAFEAIYIE